MLGDLRQLETSVLRSKKGQNVRLAKKLIGWNINLRIEGEENQVGGERVV